MNEQGSFTIRVYGLMVNEQNQVLLSTENLEGHIFTKYPGGGLQYGEGTLDCLRREFEEECGVEITIDQHLYTTDFFQPSAFRQGQQVLAIYYLCQCPQWQLIRLDEHPLADSQYNQHTIRFFWVNAAQLAPELLSFPIDKKVTETFLKAFSH